MNMRNIFLLVIQLFLLLLTSVGVMLCEVPRKQSSEIAMPFEPYALEKGFSTVLCLEHNITMHDVVTNSHKLKECPCIKFDRMRAITLVSTDERMFVVAVPLQNIDKYRDFNGIDSEVIESVKNDIAHNIGVIFPGVAKGRYGTKILPMIVLRNQDIKWCEMLLNAFIDLPNTNQMNTISKETI